MEWHGINLNDQQQTVWVRRTIKNSAILLIALVSFMLFAFLLSLHTQSIKNDYFQLKDHIQQQQNHLNSVEQKINQIKQSQTNETQEKPIEKEKITHFIQFLSQLTLNGGLETVQIQFDEQLSLNLIGKVPQKTFETLEQQLKQQNHRYKIEHLQTDQHDKLEFHLNIAW